MGYWTIIGTVSSIISAAAAIIAAYFTFISRPQKIKNIIVDVESVQMLLENHEWKIEFAVGNLDENNVLQDAMVVIKTEGLNLIRSIPRSYGGSVTLPFWKKTP